MPDDGGGSESGSSSGLYGASSSGVFYGASSGGSIAYPTDADLNCDCGLSDTGSPDVGGETGGPSPSPSSSCGGGGVCGLIVHPDSG